MVRLIYTFLLFVFSPTWGGRADRAVLPEASTVLHGLDVSHHQKTIEWDTVVAKQSIDFVFVKATEGHDFVDSLFCQNWDALQRLGVRRGAYHFFRAYGCGEEQASLFLGQVEMHPGDLAPVLDIERLDGIAPEIMLEEAGIWLRKVEQELGVKPIIYSNQHFFETYLSGHFDGYPLWIARYSEKAPELSDGKEWDFWQYTDCVCLAGIEQSEVCLDYYKGTEIDLAQFCLPRHRVVVP